MIPDLSWLLTLAAIGFIVVATVLTAIRPLVVDREKSTRKPTGTKRERLTSGIDGAHRIRLRITERSLDTVSVRARALGIVPGYQYVFVCDQLLASLSESANRAIVAHEVAHHRGWHPLLRVVLLAVALIGWPLAIASGVPYALVGGIGALPLYVLFVCWIERQTEYCADAYAGKQVGYDSMINALNYLKKTKSGRQQSRFAGLLATYPSFAERIDHLKDSAEEDDNDQGGLE
ncbi:M48 family metalloprotease (plasmid) [Halococcus dombrowskii]|uniref:M48 family metalloprotease n=1 Tax=Halococcus dombrowskii TaxID=179637 RepID=A0AAX3ASE8_HALDO|nr:M48 family metalloprotease [Halococcus dombrowskii]UOO97068.1 M48 family metalloprotease [Halococcus dombrowskii]